MVKILISVLLIGLSLLSCTNGKYHDYNTEIAQDGRFYYEMGLSSLNSGNNSQAISYLLRAIQTYKQPEVYNALALAYQFSGEYDKAQKIFEEGLNLYNDNPELLTNLGVLYAITNRNTEAIKLLEKAINHPTYSKKEKAYYNLALIYKNVGNNGLFIDYLNKAIMYNSNFLSPYIAFGDYYVENYKTTKDIRKLKLAASNYLKAINLGASSPDIYYKIGKVYIDMGERELAKYYLEKGLKLADERDPIKNQIKRTLIDITENKVRGF